MKTTLETAFEAVQELVSNFEKNKHAYVGPGYSEAEVRIDFIDKFFIALGWDVNHNIQKNPYEQEVKVERSVLIQSTQRHADYAFYLAPDFRNIRFFVEAKKPSADVATTDNCFQVIRYGWNSQTPFAVLTDFQKFLVLDSRYKPDPDTALNRAVATYHYTEYTDRKKFALIYWLFSREAVAENSLEKRAAELPKPRGKAVQRGLFPGAYKPVDESFLEELDEFRSDLARAFKATDSDLDGETLTELTQRTLDRLVFLRFLEDKGIETLRHVDNFGDKGTAWEDFIAASRRLDGIYNGIVFKQHGFLDAPTFSVDGDIFGKICERLALVNTPYDFNFIPIHILGSIYERFLGKVIVATAKRVHVEEKPDVRKAGGVYYTPEYISRYIVENTVGKLIASKTPGEIATMRFADIACGSGSFLLAMYDMLLQHHGSYYNALPNPEKALAVKRGDCIKRDDTLYLSLRKKREILLKNIYGVDIDAQAVEVAQLSLYLRLLKDETTVSTHQYLLDFVHAPQMKKLLPDLSKNIICGNSLISRDILNGQLFSGVEERKLNPMDFNDAFPEVMKHSGFDSVVGNPPYGADFTSSEKHYFKNHYTYRKGKPETYIYFLERALALLKNGGKLGYITPNALLTNYYGVQIRKHILARSTFDQVVDLEPTKVFSAAVVDTAITILTKGRKHNGQWKAQVLRGTKDFNILPYCELYQSAWENNPEFVINLQANPTELALLNKIQDSDITLGDFMEYFQGVIPYKTKEDGAANRYIAEQPRSSKWLPLIESASQVEKYIIHRPRAFIHYGPWLWCAREQRFFSEPKILFHRLRKKLAVQLVGAIDESGAINRHSLSNLILKPNVPRKNLWTFLALFNSKLANWWFIKMYGVLMEVGGFKVAKLPLPKQWSDFRQALVSLVEQMVTAKQKLAIAKTDKDKTYYANKCTSLDRQINGIIYDLYGLTEDEIKLVEG